MESVVSETKRAIQAIIAYSKDAPSHSALSTIYMLAMSAMEEYEAEEELRQNLFDKLSFPNNDVGHGAG